MSSTKGDSSEEENKNVIRSYIDEIFNKRNLSSFERYFDGDFIEGSPQAGKHGMGSSEFISEFFKAFQIGV
jgi:hypothetical protein